MYIHLIERESNHNAYSKIVERLSKCNPLPIPTASPEPLGILRAGLSCGGYSMEIHPFLKNTFYIFLFLTLY